VSGPWLVWVAAALAVANSAPQQTVPPATTAPAPAVSVSLDDAIARGLQYNLAALRAEADVGSAAGRRWQALSALLPNASGDASAIRQKINLAAFGFTAPGIPEIIGPFNVYDARVRVSQAIVDLSATANIRREALRLSAAKHDEQDARRLVALVVTTLYVNAVAAASRLDAVRAELESARTLAQLANDLKAAGIVPQIDVLRAQVQLESVEQRQIVLENALDRSKLALAQAIGLTPITPSLTLTDRLEYRPEPPVAIDAATAQAAQDREDAQAAKARVAAAEAALHAERDSRLPSLHAHGDYGTIGNTIGTALPTFAVGASVSVTIFDGARTHGRIIEAEADLRRARAEAEDLNRQIAVDVQGALLDLTSAERQVQVASHTVQLAADQQVQATDRFKAGVANNVEVVQAQAAVAAANDAYVAGLSAYQLARAALARALGRPESAFRQFLAGSRP
jgi:outer membrane protein TolC